jgi:DNA-binding YbaB/EbfC family protein
VKGFGNMMKEAQKLQEKMLAMQEEIAKRKVEATAGGGMVTVEANGKQELLSIKIDPEVINKDDAQMLEDLVLAAVRDAVTKANNVSQQAVGGLDLGGMDLGGMGLGDLLG